MDKTSIGISGHHNVRISLRCLFSSAGICTHIDWNEQSEHAYMKLIELDKKLKTQCT